MSGKYKYAVARENFEDYSSGRVLYGSPGATNFPVRLASETFQRIAARLNEKEAPPPYVLYDPCCGGGYSATVLGYLHGEQIKKIYASDVSLEALELARRNLSLLTSDGLARRADELRALIERFDKPSHRDALDSSSRLKRALERLPHAIETNCFRFDILGGADPSPEIEKVDLVFSDVPYGAATHWQGAATGLNPFQKLLDNLRNILAPASVVALTASKKQEISHDGYRRLKDIKIGKRRTILLEPLD